MSKKRKVVLFYVKYLQINYFRIIFYKKFFSINLNKYVNLNFNKRLCDYLLFYLNI